VTPAPARKNHQSVDQPEPPSLQQLVLDHGSYDRITPEAWATFDAEMKEWKAMVAAGELHQR
jgi:hypothetical protein